MPHDPFKRSSSALKSPGKASLMCNGWKVFPKRWGERNTEEERGSLKELPWQSGTISLCTYTRTLYLSHSHSSSTLSLFPSLVLAFFVLLLALFPLTVDLGVSSPCLVCGNSEKDWERAGKERKRPWEWWVCTDVCVCVRLRACVHETNSISKIHVLQAGKYLHQHLCCPKNCPPGTKCIMPIKIQSKYDTKAHSSHGWVGRSGSLPTRLAVWSLIQSYTAYQTFGNWAMHHNITCALVKVKGAILASKIKIK